MEFIPVRRLRSEPTTVWSQLARDGEVVITNNGRPMALMVDLSGKDLLALTSACRQVPATTVVNATGLSPTGNAKAWLKFVDDMEKSDEVINSDFDYLLTLQ